MGNLLTQLSQRSTVVADTGDLDAIRRFRPADATTNPSLVLKALRSGQYDALVKDILTTVRQRYPDDTRQQLADACDRLTVVIGQQILTLIPGRVSTEVSARLSFDTDASIAKARRLIQLYSEMGIPTERVLIKLVATWEGIRAAEILERDGIQCNLTLIFNKAQAQACAEAGVFLISPFVGRILDWHQQRSPGVQFAVQDEPGVESVRQILQSFRTAGHKTVVMAASFRNIGEIVALADCDRLTISPALLEALENSTEKLNPPTVIDNGSEDKPNPLDEASFRWALNADAMATEKLAEGIRGFDSDQELLETLLHQRLITT